MEPTQRSPFREESRWEESDPSAPQVLGKEEFLLPHNVVIAKDLTLVRVARRQSRNSLSSWTRVLLEFLLNIGI